jgi:RNA polymerase sigma factor (sigma-70 family)
MQPNTFAIETHLPLVRSIARDVKQTIPPHHEYDDLVSVGTLALYEAWERFDHTRSTLFSTYAYARIKGAMRDSVRSETRHDHAELYDTHEAPGCTECALNDRVEARRRVAILPVADRELIERRYFKGEKVVEIGARMKTTRQTAAKRERGALVQMRSAA